MAYTRSLILEVAEAQGLRIDYVADKMGVDRTLLYRVASGQRRITPALVAKACAFFRLPAESLFLVDSNVDSNREETADAIAV